MAPGEHARLTLYRWMRETADDDKAEALMASLPPTSWPDLATKHDLAQEVALIRQELALVEERMKATIHQALRDQTKTYIAWTSGLTAILVATFTAITTIAVR